MGENRVFLKVSEVAKRLRCHSSTVVKMIEAGRIPAERIGAGSSRNHYRIPSDFIVAPVEPVKKERKLSAELHPALAGRM